MYQQHVYSSFFSLQDEKARLEEAIARLSTDVGIEGGGGEEDERMAAIRQHLQADREKLTKIRALLVRAESDACVVIYVVITGYHVKSWEWCLCGCLVITGSCVCVCM